MAFADLVLVGTQFEIQSHQAILFIFPESPTDKVALEVLRAFYFFYDTIRVVKFFKLR